MTQTPEITFDEFKKAEIKIGTLLSAEKVPDADKLIKLMIDLGTKLVKAPNPAVLGADGLGDRSLPVNDLRVPDIRQILSGIAQYYPDPAVLIGKQVPVLTNLPVRTIRGLESQGMVLYAVGGDFLITVNPDQVIPNGTPVQ